MNRTNREPLLQTDCRPYSFDDYTRMEHQYVTSRTAEIPQVKFGTFPWIGDYYKFTTQLERVLDIPAQKH